MMPGFCIAASIVDPFIAQRLSKNSTSGYRQLLLYQQLCHLPVILLFGTVSYSPISRTFSITTKVLVCSTWGRAEIFSPSTMR